MDFSKFIKTQKEAIQEQHAPEPANVEKTDEDFYATINPDTGYRFDIPMLDKLDPQYYFKYVDHMKRKDIAPETFEKLLNWD